MSSDRETVRRYYEELWNRGDLSVAPLLIAPQAVFRGTKAITARSRNEFLRYVQTLRGGFPDLSHRIEDLKEEAGRITARVAVEGTHQGRLGPVAPTGRRVSYTLESDFRLSGGKIVECSVRAEDEGALLRQIRGEAPKPEKSSFWGNLTGWMRRILGKMEL